MKYLSLFSGIEAASVAWHDLGWEPMGFSEIEPFPCAVLKHRFPEVPNLGDVTKIHETEIFKRWQSERTIDLVVGGSPCQSFSVAGLRKGMDDPRGNLALVYLGIVDKLRPRCFIWENVPGVLSSNGGRDFGSFLGAVRELGYGFAYRVLDAQYVRTHGHPRAVPQRRRRVFVVGSLGGWQRATSVLFDIESLSGNPAPRRTKGKGAAGTTENSVGDTSTFRYVNAGNPLKESDVSQTLKSRFGVDERTAGAIVMSTGQANAEVAENHSRTLNCNHEAPIVFKEREGKEGGGKGILIDKSGSSFTLSTHQDQVVFENHPNDSRIQEYGPEDAINTLGAQMGTGGGNVDLVMEPIGIDEEVNASEGYFGTLKSRMEGGGFEGSVMEPIPINSMSSQGRPDPTNDARMCIGIGNEGDPQFTISKAHHHAVFTNRIRRLTPEECERLQGFPTGWTQVPYRNKPASDGPRYKAVGNSMAVNVMRWIGQRIAMSEDITPTP